MEPALAGALYTAENLLTGAVAFAKGIAHPTLPLKATLTHITSVPLPRQNHTVSVVKGRAYIFGGETAKGELADNAMNIVILPSSGVLEADFTAAPARPREHAGPVPAARKGHTAVVIGDSIYVFGGEGVDNEKGRVWVYSTVENSWSYLDPASGSSSFPSHRRGHAAVGAELPGPKVVTYKEQAPQKPADPAKVVPVPAEENSWGTVFVVGGRKVGDSEAEGEGELLNDAWAFDVKSRTWSEIPSPSGQPREGASLALVGDNLYRFGGKGAEAMSSATMQYLEVSSVWKHAEGGTTPMKSGWGWEESGHHTVEGHSSADANGPQARSGAGLESVTTGQGRHYLLAVGGESASSSPESLSSTFLDDIWAFQLLPEHGSAASIKDATRNIIKKDTHMGQWAEVKYQYADTRGEDEKLIPGTPERGMGRRGRFAVSKGTEVDGASVVAWGGVDREGRVLGDGWLITVDR